MTKTMTMEETVAQLRDATNGMVVSFSLAWNDGPDVGVRRDAEIGKHEPRADSIIIGDTVWLIAGDVLDAKSYDRFKSVRSIANADVSELLVNIQAQASVYGSIVQIGLGKHRVKERHMISEECGQLVLE